MFWLYLVVLANLISAIVILIDTYLVGPRAIGKSEVYAFYIGLLSIVVLVMVPYGSVTLPGINIIIIALVVGLSYMASIIAFYKALQISHPSDVAPALGAVTAISSYIFGYFFLASTLSQSFFLAFVLLVTGTFLMSYFHFTKLSLLYIVAAGVLFGYSSVFLKILFAETSFADAFFWSRIANVFWALTILLIPVSARAVLKNVRTASRKTKSLVLVNKALAGVAAFLIFIALKLSSNISLVNALAGVQFVFLLLFAFILPKKYPHYFEETKTMRGKSRILHRIVATILVITGFFVLFL